MKLSVVVVAYNIPRELPRTLLSLSVGYQRGVDETDYEVIVVDNGSTPAVNAAIFDGLSGQFRLVRIDDASKSPAQPANVGIGEARGDVVGVLIDGARLVSPGFIHFALAGASTSSRPAIVTLGWYLGYDFQQHALQSGWTKADEDALLEGIDWPGDGYRLFEVSTMDESSVNGWVEPIFESNALFLSRATWAQLGGFDVRFDSAGGGLVNHDVLRRASEIEGLDWMILLGEATFHQLHYGISSNASLVQHVERMHHWDAEYLTIRQRDVELVELPNPSLIGMLPASLQPRYSYALNAAPSLIPLSDPALEPDPIATQWFDRAVKAAANGQPIEAMTFARWGRELSSNTSAAGPLLSFVAANTSVDRLPPEAFASFHAEAGMVCVDSASFDNAAAHFAEALLADPTNSLARYGLSRLRMPGVTYDEVLRWVHAELQPATYLEIGVEAGGTLALARPPTVAVGVDPVPAITQPIAVQHHLYPETSSDFFEHRDVLALFGGPPSLVFIDGLHQFPAVLKDFLQVEAICGRDTLVVLHDTIPVDEITQRPERVLEFYTGDVWKLLHCLAAVRPDLSIATVRTAPSGLTFVTGLNPKSKVLQDRYDELVERYDALTFEDASVHPVPFIENSREHVAAWLANSRTTSPAWKRLLRRSRLLQRVNRRVRARSTRAA